MRYKLCGNKIWTCKMGSLVQTFLEGDVKILTCSKIWLCANKTLTR